MKITVFTSNQPRHIAFINRLSKISEITYAVMECNTRFPGIVPDFYKKSGTMQNYFSNVINAENSIFGNSSFTNSNVRVFALKSGDLNYVDRLQLGPALKSDIYIVFGASYIKGWLIDYLIAQSAINIHMGLSPFYRGSACNFWALFDGRPEFVGATIHMLSRGLDDGPILYHAIPSLGQLNPFEFTMLAVDAAQQSLVQRIIDNKLNVHNCVEQDKNLQIRYSKNADFTDAVAASFLERELTNEKLRGLYEVSRRPNLIDPFYL